MRMVSQWIVLLLLLCVVPIVAAQSDCQGIVQKALDVTSSVCSQTGRNQACYGNLTLQATPREGVTDLSFSKTGDIADLVKIENISLSPMIETSQEWGVALLRIQANLPDTLPGQNVTMLLFGNVEMSDASTAVPVASATPVPVVLDVTSVNGSNVRAEPSTSAAIAGSLAKGQTVNADGRNEAGDWLHIQLDDGVAGWVATRLVTVDGDASTLPVEGSVNTVPATTVPAPQYGPLQAFYFRSGAGDAPCAEAPDSGILIQTPQGAGEVNIRADEVNIQLGSTIYLQAQPGGEMTTSVVEGAAWIEAQGIVVYAPAGTRVRVPLDANGVASGAPVEPEAYISADLAALPLRTLPDFVTIATPLTQDEIATLVDPLLPTPGRWTNETVGATGPDGCLIEVHAELDLNVEAEGAVLVLPGGRFVAQGRGSMKVKSPSSFIPSTYHFQVLNPDAIEYHVIMTYPSGAQCDVEFSMNRIS